MMVPNILGYLLAGIRFAIIILTMAFLVGLGVVLMKLRLANQNLAFWIRMNWCKMALWVMGVRIHKSGHLKIEDGTLYVGNHRSFIDPLVAFSFIKRAYAVSKKEVSTYPLIHTGAVLSGVIYVDRPNADSRHSAKSQIEENLKLNRSIVIFPEGTTSTTNESKPFRKGSFEAAAACGHPVVVFALEMGNPKRDFWYEEGLLGLYFKCFSKWRTDIYLHFFDPIRGDSGEALALQAQQLVNDKLKEFQKNW